LQLGFKELKIKHITCYEVVVPARPGAVASASIDKPLHMLPVGVKSGWSVQFDQLPKVIVRLELDNGIIGWGELYRSHNPQQVEDIANMLLGMNLTDLTLQNLPFAFCREYDGFECAIWDAYAKAHNLRVVDLLGGPVRNKVRVGAWSSHRQVEEVGDLVSGFSEQGYDCIKFKSDLEDDVISWCRIIADRAPGMQVIIDPNQRWENAFQVRSRLDALREIGNVLCLEDPIPRWQLNEYASLKQYSAVAIVRHISLPYVLQGQRIKDAIECVRLAAVDGFNFNGGLANFQRLDHIADSAGLPCWHGSEVDLGILEAMYIHSSAAAASCVWPGDIFGRLIREHDLLKESLKIEPPFANLPRGAGLGVEPDLQAIEHYMINKREYYCQ
jgi:muconate cycloisomerase